VATAVDLKVPDGDFLPRHVCGNCGIIHYQNPKIVVGSVPSTRAHPDLQARHRAAPGFLDNSRGFMENDETLEAGAAREAREGSAHRRGDRQPADSRQRHACPAVHVFFRSRMRTPHYGVTHESLEVRADRRKGHSLGRAGIPSTEFALRRFVDDRAAGVERYHVAEMQRRFM
jgi:hypothetical protein